MDNIWLGRYPMTAGIMVNEHKMLEDTNKIFEELGIAVDPKRIMSTMPVSQKADGRDREKRYPTTVRSLYLTNLLHP